MPIRVGLLPTIATHSLLKLYDPLRQHLQQALGRPVELYTSGSFHAYLDDIAADEFDVLVAAPHFGVIAADRGYVPLSRYKLELTPLIVVPKESALREARQLRGKRVLTADRLTAISVVAETWLFVDYGLRAGVDYDLVEVSSHSTAIRAVAIGDADAAISSGSVMRQIPEDLRERVAFFSSRLSMPHQFILAHPRLGAETVQAIRTALGEFENTDRGRTFFTAGGFKGLVPVSAADMEQARPYANMVKKAGSNSRSSN
ncbi:phosphate/phosphite/phosphonate ABC transporter substrate-binding protein [Paramagnetospirillum magneticum]|uniref:phosphate/phosphite/phosphonate ABC transporter substrate-binding protein n=1 Tax=Paramagnetospirillum magneticum TaxID=84159 RepID=UPI0002EE021B|nr:phosphate/phosphite/phosphonate ABC transporter substrate-binding protein [Paramagnetospirillum magneticum]